jgi:multidrug efflux pump subunit AcrB
MWIVELALRRPLSVAVMGLLMLVLGALSFALMNVDIFPAINLPVVLVVYNYPGLSAIDMERRIILISERADSTTVNGIDHIESESFEGIGLKRIYFQPGTDMGAAIETQRYRGDDCDDSPARHGAAGDHLLQRSQRAGRPAQCLQ